MTSRRNQKKAERRRLAMMFSEVTRSIGYVRRVDLVSRESHRGRRKRKALAKADGVPWWSLPMYRDRGLCLCLCYDRIWRAVFSGKRTSSRMRQYTDVNVTEVEARNPYTATIALAEKASNLAKFIRGSRERTAERRSRRDA